jgi:hypothetical protein
MFLLWWIGDLWDGFSGEGRVIATIVLFNFLLTILDRVLDRFKDKAWSQRAHVIIDRIQTVLSWIMMNRKAPRRGAP